jgi:VWFA-related protein
MMKLLEVGLCLCLSASSLQAQVIIDAVVTGKSGFVRDLTQKDFRLSGDGKEQVITSAALQSEAASPQRPGKQFLALLFDSTTVAASDQLQIRQYVDEFLDAAAGPNRYVAVLTWFTGLKVVQPFTVDTTRLRKALDSTMATAAMSPSGSSGSRSGVGVQDTKVQNLMQNLALLADSLQAIRGRKALVLFTGGYSYSADDTVFIEAALAACNRANVAIHVISNNSAWAQEFANNTGGTAIHVTSNLPAALQKIAEEQAAYYLLNFTPSSGLEEGCHQVRLRMAAGGLDVRARRQYCATSRDPLAGKPAGKDLESRAAGASAGVLTGTVQLPYFYTATNQARVNVAADLSPAGMMFRRDKGKYVGEMNVVGLALKADGAIGARFSDVVQLSFDRQEQAEAFTKGFFAYEAQFELPAGRYTFRMAFSTGEGFGKIEVPLLIESRDSTQLGMGGVTFGRIRRGLPTGLTTELDPTLLEGLVPLVASGFQVAPMGTTFLRIADAPVVYTEIYTPAASGDSPAVSLQVRILERVSGTVKQDSGQFSIASNVVPGNRSIPVAFDVPVKLLGPGAYRLEVKASSGASSASRTVEFELK